MLIGEDWQIMQNFHFTITEFFDDSVDSLIDLLERIRPNKISIDTERPELDKSGESFVGGNNIKVLARKFEEIYLKLRETDLNFGVGCYMPLCKLEPRVLEILLADKKMAFGCHLMNGKSIIMEPNGNFIPCNHMCNIPLAQFGKDILSAEDYWKFKESEQCVELLKHMNLAPDKRCVDCELWSICGGSCRLRWMSDVNPLD